ncbi:transposase [Pseudomonas chlororaphis]|uniref:transposase n=1 Tax=Pseudomonas chlororaphis TaxID=587753 RepID=UPI000F5861DD|nr:transposase [Pseudomonas chlororaphis]
MNIYLDCPVFQDEKLSLSFLEGVIWNGKPICPRCNEIERIAPIGGNSTRLGVFKCYACRKPFTAKVGTVFDGSHLGLTVWFKALSIVYSSENKPNYKFIKGVLGVSHKSAYSILKRIDEIKGDGWKKVVGSNAKCCSKASLELAMFDVAAKRVEWFG